MKVIKDVKKLHKKIPITNAIKEVNRIKEETKRQVLTAVLAAFGFVIALTWNESIKAIVLEITKKVNMVGIENIGLNAPYISQIITSVFVTLICVIGIIVITRLNK